MFGPLAWTKTFILIASLIIVVTMIPGFAHWLYSQKVNTDRWRLFWNGGLIACGLSVAFTLYGWGGLILITLCINNLAAMYGEKSQPWAPRRHNGIVLLGGSWVLAGQWLPRRPETRLSSTLLLTSLT